MESIRKDLNLDGVSIDDAIGLSDSNVSIFNQQGDYKGFKNNEIRELLLGDERQQFGNVTTIELKDRGLDNKSANIITRNSKKWINLKKLDLSKNNLSDDDVNKIFSRSAFPKLQELILSSTSSR